jgi:hypothetical protein
MTRQNYRVWAAAALGLCLVGALALLAWLWLDVHTTGFVPVALRSVLRADYSADPRGTPLPALNLGIIEQVIADQPTATTAPTGATRLPGPATPTATIIPITVLLQTPVPSVTPLLLPGQPSPTHRPTETPPPTPTPSAVVVPSVTPEASATSPENATATPTVIAGATSTLVNVASRTPVVSIPSATPTARPPTLIAPTATLAPPPTSTFAPPPTNTRAPTAAPPSSTPPPPPSNTPAPPPTNTPNAYPPPVTVPPATGYP